MKSLSRRPLLGALGTALLGVLALGLLAPRAKADGSARVVLNAGARRVLQVTASGAQGLHLPVRVESPAAALALGLLPISSRVAVGHFDEGRLQNLPGVASPRFAPPRRLFLDAIDAHVGARTAQKDYGVDGAGVIVGVVDTGIDASHPAFLAEDGTSRIRWMLAYGQKPQGLQPELEEAFGCVESEDCAVFSRDDINALLAAADTSVLPRDRIGHGSHITSIAVSSEAVYRGMAPGAELIIVQAADREGSVLDARILEGARFIFDRASEAQLPAVANLSLGSSFGAHDGSSALEEALVELASGPGRAIVVASGNEGGRYESLSPDYPAPMGIHTEVFVPESTVVRVPILTPPDAQGGSGSLFVWVSTAPGDEISVAFSNGLGAESEAMAPGQSGATTSEGLDEPLDEADYELLLTNGVDDDLQAGIQPGSAVLGLVGTWDPGRAFELILTGHGTARLWVQSGGAVAPGRTQTGVTLPGARGHGTVSVPGSAADLIAVGASNNRNTWTDYTGTEVALPLGEIGTLATFSGAGPDQRGSLRPDVVAPGTNVVAAMAAPADPRGFLGQVSQFQSDGSCYSSDVECFVADEFHAVASGTSMAAPVVSGAVALLFQRDPSLTMKQVQALLRAGTRATASESSDQGEAGAGQLDIELLLQAQDLMASAGSILPSPKKSRIVLADSFLRPDPSAEIQGVVVLRDNDDRPAGGFEKERLTVKTTAPGHARISDVSAGLATIWVSAESGHAEETVEVEVLFDGERLTQISAPIHVDFGSERSGAELSGGLCAASGAFLGGAPAGHERASNWRSGWLAVLLVGIGFARRRARPRARRGAHFFAG